MASTARPRACAHCFQKRAWGTVSATPSTSSWQTHGDRVAGVQGTPLAVPYPLVPGASAQELAGVCPGPTVTPLRRPCDAKGGGGQWGAGPALVPGEEDGLVCGPRRPTDARDQYVAGSGP